MNSTVDAKTRQQIHLAGIMRSTAATNLKQSGALLSCMFEKAGRTHPAPDAAKVRRSKDGLKGNISVEPAWRGRCHAGVRVFGLPPAQGVRRPARRAAVPLDTSRLRGLPRPLRAAGRRPLTGGAASAGPTRPDLEPRRSNRDYGFILPLRRQGALPPPRSFGLAGPAIGRTSVDRRAGRAVPTRSQPRRWPAERRRPGPPGASAARTRSWPRRSRWTGPEGLTRNLEPVNDSEP